MVKLNLPFSDQGPVPVQQGAQVDPGRLTALASATTQGLNQMLDTAYGQAENFRQQSARAEALAVEARNNADLARLAPAAMKGIGDALTNTANALMTIDQQQYEHELPLREKAYMLEGTYNLQTEYMALKDKLSSSYDRNATAKLQDFVQNRAIDYLQKAPSEDSKLDMLGKVAKFKLAAYEDGLRIQHSAVTRDNFNKLNNASESVLRSARSNPEDLGPYKAQIDQVAKAYVDAGASPSDVQTYKSGIMKRLYNDHVDTLLKSGNTDKAISVLGSKDARAALPIEDIALQVDKTAQYALKEVIGAKFNMQEQIGYKNFLQGNISKDMPNASKYADIGFLQFKSALGSNEGTTKDNWNAISNNMVNWFNQNNKVIGKQSVNYILNNALDDKNIPNALAHSAVIDRIFNDKQSGSNALAPQIIKEANPKDLAASLQFSRLVRNGVAPEQAMASVQADRSTVLTADQKKERVKEVNDFWKKNNPTEVAWGHFDTWMPAESEPVNLNMYADELRKQATDYFTVTKDMNTALAMAEANLKDKYALTTVNGRKEIMLGAPDLYVSSIDKFNNELKTNVSNALSTQGYEVDIKKGFTAKRNNDIIELGIKPIYNYTENQKEAKTYYVVNKNTEVPMTSDDGRLMTFTYSVDKSKYKSNRDMIIDGFKQRNLEYTSNDYNQLQVYKRMEASGAFKDLSPENLQKIKSNMDALSKQFPDVS